MGRGVPGAIGDSRNDDGGASIVEAPPTKPTNVEIARHTKAKELLGDYWQSYHYRAQEALTLIPEIELLDAVNEAIVAEFTKEDLVDPDKRNAFLATLHQIAQSRIALVNAESERLRKSGHLYKATEVAFLFGEVFALILRYVKDPIDRESLIKDIEQLSTRAGFNRP